MPDTIPRADVLELARDNFLARFVAGGRSAAEVAAIAQTERMEDTEANRIRGPLIGGGGGVVVGEGDKANRIRGMLGEWCRGGGGGCLNDWISGRMGIRG